MPRPRIGCINPGNPRLPADARVASPVVPLGKSLMVDAIGDAAGTMVCALAYAIIQRMRFARD